MPSVEVILEKNAKKWPFLVKKSEVTVFRGLSSSSPKQRRILKTFYFHVKDLYPVVDNCHSTLTKWKNNENLSPRGPSGGWRQSLGTITCYSYHVKGNERWPTLKGRL
jgi:hypothetical protein